VLLLQPASYRLILPFPDKIASQRHPTWITKSLWTRQLFFRQTGIKQPWHYQRE
jgi:hypothetical protein